jgi:hypothetical protein
MGPTGQDLCGSEWNLASMSKNCMNVMGIEVKEIYFPWMEFRLDSRGWNVLEMIGKVFDGRALKMTRNIDDVNKTKK